MQPREQYLQGSGVENSGGASPPRATTTGGAWVHAPPENRQKNGLALLCFISLSPPCKRWGATSSATTAKTHKQSILDFLFPCFLKSASIFFLLLVRSGFSFSSSRFRIYFFLQIGLLCISPSSPVAALLWRTERCEWGGGVGVVACGRWRCCGDEEGVVDGLEERRRDGEGLVLVGRRRRPWIWGEKLRFRSGVWLRWGRWFCFFDFGWGRESPWAVACFCGGDAATRLVGRRWRGCVWLRVVVVGKPAKEEVEGKKSRGVWGAGGCLVREKNNS